MKATPNSEERSQAHFTKDQKASIKKDQFK